MIWLLWGVLGSVSVAIVNSFWRLNPWNFSFWTLLLITIIPTTFGTQLGFLQLYQKAPSFLVAWYLGTGMTVITGFMASVIVFNEQPSLLNIIGISLILFGGYLLTK